VKEKHGTQINMQAKNNGKKTRCDAMKTCKARNKENSQTCKLIGFQLHFFNEGL